MDQHFGLNAVGSFQLIGLIMYLLSAHHVSTISLLDNSAFGCLLAVSWGNESNRTTCYSCVANQYSLIYIVAGQRKERELEEANKAPCGLSSEPADHCFCHLLLSKGKSQGQPKFTESRKTLPLCGRSHNAREWTQTRKELYAFLTVYLNLYFKNSCKQWHKLTRNVVICTFVVICSVWSSAKRIVALVLLEILVSLGE